MFLSAVIYINFLNVFHFILKYKCLKNILGKYFLTVFNDIEICDQIKISDKIFKILYFTWKKHEYELSFLRNKNNTCFVIFVSLNVHLIKIFFWTFNSVVHSYNYSLAQFLKCRFRYTFLLQRNLKLTWI